MKLPGARKENAEHPKDRRKKTIGCATPEGKNPKERNEPACIASYLFIRPQQFGFVFGLCGEQLTLMWQYSLPLNPMCRCLNLVLTENLYMWENEMAWVANDQMETKQFVIIFIWHFNNCTRTSYCILCHFERMPTHVSVKLYPRTPHSTHCRGAPAPFVPVLCRDLHATWEPRGSAHDCTFVTTRRTSVNTSVYRFITR